MIDAAGGDKGARRFLSAPGDGCCGAGFVSELRGHWGGTCDGEGGCIVVYLRH